MKPLFRPERLHHLLEQMENLQESGVIDAVVSAYIYQGQVDFLVIADTHYTALSASEALVEAVEDMLREASPRTSILN